MYEHFRNEFQCIAHEQGMCQQAIVDAMNVLDMLASRYEFSNKETSMTVYNEELPEIVKIYLVSKKNRRSISDYPGHLYADVKSVLPEYPQGSCTDNCKRYPRISVPLSAGAWVF